MDGSGVGMLGGGAANRISYTHACKYMHAGVGSVEHGQQDGIISWRCVGWACIGWGSKSYFDSTCDAGDAMGVR